MDRHAAAAGDPADDVVTRDGRAALGETDEEVVHAVDDDAVIVAPSDLTDGAFKEARPEVLGLAVFFGADNDVGEVRGLDLAVADLCEELVHAEDTKVRLNALELGLVLEQPREGEARLMKGSLAEVPTKLDGALALFAAQVAANA